MNRRSTLTAVLALGVASKSLHVSAQVGTRKIALLSNSVAPLPGGTFQKRLGRMKARLGALGWSEGQNLVYEGFFTGGSTERLPTLVDEIIRKNFDVILPTSTSSAVAASRLTKTIPIVMLGSCAFPVECGLIKSFAQPGGNVTGLAFFEGIAVQSKLVQFVRQLLPSDRRLAWIALPADLVMVAGGEFRPETYYVKVARSAGFELSYYECRTLEDFDQSFAALRSLGVQAVIVEAGVLSAAKVNSMRIADLALKSGVLTVFSLASNAIDGGLLSYGPDLEEIYQQAMTYADRILRGAHPADLPVEMPSKLELVINVKTAKALGVEIPKTLLLLANNLIQ